MTTEQFNKIVEERKKKISAILQKKSQEYARGGDRLHNFQRAAAFAMKEPTTMCWGFAMKHLTSLADLVDDVESGKGPEYDMQYVDEKIGDAINYLILLEALLRGIVIGGRE
jgi:hypothetical protein